MNKIIIFALISIMFFFSYAKPQVADQLESEWIQISGKDSIKKEFGSRNINRGKGFEIYNHDKKNNNDDNQSNSFDFGTNNSTFGNDEFNNESSYSF